MVLTNCCTLQNWRFLNSIVELKTSPWCVFGGSFQGVEDVLRYVEMCRVLVRPTLFQQLDRYRCVCPAPSAGFLL